MKKADIIETVLKIVRGREAELTIESEDVPTYVEHVIAELESKLGQIEPDQNLPTCANFLSLGVECCPVCHIDYPEWELALVEIESGGRAWLCCSLDRALNPSRLAAMERSSKYQELARLFGVDPSKSECGT